VGTQYVPHWQISIFVTCTRLVRITQSVPLGQGSTATSWQSTGRFGGSRPRSDLADLYSATGYVQVHCPARRDSHNICESKRDVSSRQWVDTLQPKRAASRICVDVCPWIAVSRKAGIGTSLEEFGTLTLWVLWTRRPQEAVDLPSAQDPACACPPCDHPGNLLR
jgi:hypothetical protein